MRFPFIALFFILFQLAGCSSTLYNTSQGVPADNYPPERAKKIIREKVKSWAVFRVDVPVSMTNVQFNGNQIVVSGNYVGQPYTLTCTILMKYSAGAVGGQLNISTSDNATYWVNGIEYTFSSTAPFMSSMYEPVRYCAPKFTSLEDAKAFAHAWLSLKKNGQGGGNLMAEVQNGLNQFTPNVPSYQKLLGGKLPEEARRHRVIAENAFKEKKYDLAAEEYRKALEISPWWSYGYFNRAMLLGELDDYAGALLDMRKFLLLEPNGKDARSAQDKIYIWESKLGQ